jgi:hypothetical protein
MFLEGRLFQHSCEDSVKKTRLYSNAAEAQISSFTASILILYRCDNLQRLADIFTNYVHPEHFSRTTTSRS